MPDILSFDSRATVPEFSGLNSASLPLPDVDTAITYSAPVGDGNLPFSASNDNSAATLTLNTDQIFDGSGSKFGGVTLDRLLPIGTKDLVFDPDKSVHELVQSGAFAERKFLDLSEPAVANRESREAEGSMVISEPNFLQFAGEDLPQAALDKKFSPASTEEGADLSKTDDDAESILGPWEHRQVGRATERERLAGFEKPAIKVVYSDTSRSSDEKRLVPDFIVDKDGTVYVANDPEVHPRRQIVIEVAREPGRLEPPTDAQRKSLEKLLKYLNARIEKAYPNAVDQPLKVDDGQGLLPDEAKNAVDAAPAPEDSLPAPTRQQVQNMSRVAGSSGGSLSPAEAGDYFPPSEVPKLPSETDHLSAMKEVAAGFATRGVDEPYSALQSRGDRGWGVGRYALTAVTIFDWIGGLSDEDLDEIKELEVTTADGKKIKIRVPAGTSAKLRKFRDAIKAAKERNQAKGSEEGDPNSELKKLFDDPEVKDFSQFLMKLRSGKEKPSGDEIAKSFGPEMQELVAADLVHRFAKRSLDEETGKVDVGAVALAMHLGHFPDAGELRQPQYISLMNAARLAFPLALQHVLDPSAPVTWNEKNGTVESDPNNYFFSQYRNPKFNPNGPDRSNNCGPAALAMAAASFGRDGGIDDPERQIQRARVAMTGRNNRAEKTSNDQIVNGAGKLGLQAQAVSNMSFVDEALDSGKKVVAFGNPANSYANRLSNSKYSYYDGLHFMLVTERKRDDDGRVVYSINDPLSRVGAISVTREELSKYMVADRSGRIGVSVWA